MERVISESRLYFQFEKSLVDASADVGGQFSTLTLGGRGKDNRISHDLRQIPGFSQQFTQRTRLAVLGLDFVGQHVVYRVL